VSALTYHVPLVVHYPLARLRPPCSNPRVRERTDGVSPMAMTQVSAASDVRPAAEAKVLTERTLMWNAKRVSDSLTFSGGHTVSGRDFVCAEVVEFSASRACPVALHQATQPSTPMRP
jgi:hypothetical protein